MVNKKMKSMPQALEKSVLGIKVLDFFADILGKSYGKETADTETREFEDDLWTHQYLCGK